LINYHAGYVASDYARMVKYLVIIIQIIDSVYC